MHFEVNSVSKTRTGSLAKGAVAGLIGGLVATAAKSAVERIYPPQKRRELALANRTAVQESKHWGFGAAAGAAYGVAAEFYPAATSKQGASFGMALIALKQDNVLPALRLAAKPEVQSKREHTSELASFVVYGVVTETVRRVVRRMIE